PFESFLGVHNQFLAPILCICTLFCHLGRASMAANSRKTTYRFTFGPWNISTGADPFGPPVRKEVAFAAKIREYKKLGFDGVQFHDDDVVEADLDPQATERGAAKVRKMLESEGLFCEF